MTTPDLNTTIAVPATTPQERVGALVQAAADIKGEDLIEVLKLEGVIYRDDDNLGLDEALAVLVHTVHKLKPGKAVYLIWMSVLSEIVRRADRVNGEPSR